MFAAVLLAVAASASAAAPIWGQFGNTATHSHSTTTAGSQTGTLKWTFASGAAIESSPAIAGDGTVIVGSEDGNLYALDGVTGAVKWKTAAGGAIDSSPAIAADGDTVFVGSAVGVLAVNTADGTPIMFLIVWDSVVVLCRTALGASCPLSDGKCSHRLLAQFVLDFPRRDVLV